MKHVELKMLVIQEWIAQGRLKVNKVNTHLNCADLMTKSVPIQKQIRFGRVLGLRGKQFDDATFDRPDYVLPRGSAAEQVLAT